MTDTVIDVPAPPPAVDVAIANHRSTYADALGSRAHPEHSIRVAQLSALFERKFSGDISAVPEGKPASTAATPKADLVGGNEPAESIGDVPLTDAGQVSFDSLKAKEIPGAAPDEKLEAVAKEWAVAGGLNATEAEGLSLIYGMTLGYSDIDIQRAEQIGEQHLRTRYGEDYRKAATAAMRVAEETYGLADFLNANPAFAANPQVIDKLVSTAEKRGFFKRSA
jgi:hypothetical protein